MSDNQNIIDKLKNQGLKPNINQIELISKLNDIKIKKRKIFEPNNSNSGIYVWGDVGRGKTLITKEFLNTKSKERIKDFHYIDFMNFVHLKLNNLSGSKNPLKMLSKSLNKDYDLIFIDEFQVEDVADAMIIGDLLNRIIDGGMKLILTSNAHPNDLYKDGLQRQKFIKSMDILKEKILVYKLEGDIDYRTKNFIEVDDNTKSAYSEEEIEKLIKDNYGSEPINTNYIEIKNRKFECKLAMKNLLWVEYQSFFKQPLGSSDYKYISKNYDWIFINKFSICNDENIDTVRRFISFIDVAYADKTKIKFFFNIKEQDIYKGNMLDILWKRCHSRLIEMQSFKYLSKD
jgi:cell division protein ZapE